MEHTDLIEVLTRLTDHIETLEVRIGDMSKVLAEWHRDYENRFQAQSQAIERNRERLASHAKRIASLESSPNTGDIGAE
jgi:hypothetical protein